MKPQFANMTLEEFMKEMEPYMTPDRYDHLSPEELRIHTNNLRIATKRVHKTVELVRGYITEQSKN